MRDTESMEHIGKQMPYRVPTGFFDDLESNIRKEIGLPASSQKETRGKIKYLWQKVVAGMAAAVILFVVLFTPSANIPDDKDVEQAFLNLSVEDQDFLMSVYQEDIFIY